MVRKKNESQRGEPAITPLELEIMQIIWQRGNATAAEVGDALGPDRPLAGTTIHTVLANLRKKNYIKPIPTIERVLRFAPCVPREQVATRSLRKLMQDFFGNSPQRLLAHLMREETVSEAEMAELQNMLRTSKKKERKP